MSIARILDDYIDVGNFLENTLKIEKLIEENGNFLASKHIEKEFILDWLIKNICLAERNDSYFYKYNTLDSDKFKLPEYRDPLKRKKLRDTIADELLSFNRLDDDDEIILGKGGMKPSTNVKLEGKVYIIIGAPASGKSRIASKIAEEKSAYLLDSDYVKRKIPEYFNNINGASLVHKESKDILLNDLMPNLTSLKCNIVYPIVGSKYDEFSIMVKELFVSKGYQVCIILTELDRVQSTQRAMLRFAKTNRYVSLPMILDDYSHNSILTFYKLLTYENQYSYILVNTQNKEYEIKCWKNKDLYFNLDKICDSINAIKT